jgi:pyruvate formate lyase activating enzyme
MTYSYPIKGFLETSFSDWPGKIASVLFLPSCNFRCPFCHNHELVLRPEEYPDFPWEFIAAGLRRRRGWIDGVCVTGGEPTIHPWLPRFIRELKKSRAFTATGEPLGIKLDTNGSHPEVLEEIIGEGLLDYVAMDLKGPLDPGRYSAMAGIALSEKGIERIESSIGILLQGKVDFEFRTTVVPALLTEEEVYGLARRVRGAPRYTLQNFKPREALDENLRGSAPLGEELLARMRRRVNEIIRKDSLDCQYSGHADLVGAGSSRAYTGELQK